MLFFTCAGTAEELYQRETQERVSLKGKELDHISKEQKSTSQVYDNNIDYNIYRYTSLSFSVSLCLTLSLSLSLSLFLSVCLSVSLSVFLSLSLFLSQSLHATVQKALGSGDAGTLASISLSNCQLLKLMNSNHVKLEDSVWELNEERNGMRDRIRSRLQSLAELQQEMTRIDSKLQLYSGQIQLLRRKFEVLEQICAAPHMMSSILEEVRQRKLFRKFFIEVSDQMNSSFIVVLNNYRKVRKCFEGLRHLDRKRRVGDSNSLTNVGNILFSLFFHLSQIDSLTSW